MTTPTKKRRRGAPKKPKDQLKVPTTVRLSRPTIKENAMLAKHWNVDRTASIERAINEALGRIVVGPGYISPLDPAHPNHHA